MADKDLEEELISALKRRVAVIGDRALRESDPVRQLAELKEVSEKIVALEARLPATTHPQLRHYFERCSYDKALAWLEQEGLTGSMR